MTDDEGGQVAGGAGEAEEPGGAGGPGEAGESAGGDGATVTPRADGAHHVDREAQAGAVAQPGPRRGGSQLLWVFGIVVVVVMTVAVIAVVVTRGDDDGGGGDVATEDGDAADDSAAGADDGAAGGEDVAGGGASASGGTVVPSGDVVVGELAVSGNGLPPLGADGTDPAVGAVAPELVGQGFDGSPVEVARDGTPRVVVFLAHWCQHCQAEVPRLQGWLDANGMPADVQLVAVATSNEPSRPNHPPGAWLRRESWSVPTMVDDETSTAGIAYGVSSFPFFVVLDGEGRVVDRVSGEISADAFGELVDAAAASTPPA